MSATPATRVQVAPHVSVATWRESSPDGWDDYVTSAGRWDCAQLSAFGRLAQRHGGQAIWLAATDDRENRWLAAAQLVRSPANPAGTDGQFVLWKGPAGGPASAFVLSCLLRAALLAGPARVVLALPWLLGTGQQADEPWTPAPCFMTSLTEVRHDTDALLARMAPSTRSRVRRGLRAGVRVATGAEHLDGFWPVYRECMERQNSPDFASLDYLRDLLSHRWATLFAGFLGDEVVAGSVCLTSSDSIEARYVATSERARSVAPLNVVHLESMRWARAAGLRYLDFAGIGHGEGKEGQINRFKLGFGGGIVGFQVVEVGEK